MSTAAYDAFLARLDTLTTPEIDAIYDAYELIRRGVQASREARTLTDRRMAVLQVFFWSENALNGMERALRSLPSGNRNVERLLRERGSDRERAAGITAAFQETFRSDQPADETQANPG